jgi:F-type H+-transporting ATPase subunit delta
VIPSSLYASYSRALVDVALEIGSEPAVTKDLLVYRQIFREVPEVVAALHNPAIPKAAKERVLSALMEKYPVTATTGNFMRVLLDHNRFTYFSEIVDCYLRTLDERNGILPALATVVSPLTEAQAEDLRKNITEATGHEVKLEVRPDPGLIGGLVLQLGSTVYDGSVRKQLENIRQRLTSG